MRNFHIALTATFLLIATAAFAAASSEPTKDAASALRSASSLSLEIDANGVRVEIHDPKVAEIQVEIYDPSGALVFDSGRAERGAVHWPNALAGGTYRFSIRGWDDEGTLVTHQVSTQGTTEIVSLDFETFPTGVTALGASITMAGPTVVGGRLDVNGDLDVDDDLDVGGDSLFDGDVEVEGDVEITGGTPLRITDDDAGGVSVRIIANPEANGDLLELLVPFNVTGGQFIEFETVGAGLDVVAAINTDGTAFFGRSPTQLLPAFLPIAFGYVRENGTIASGSGNFTAFRDGLNIYHITITGENYDFEDYTTTVTASENFLTLIPSTGGNGELLVLFRESDSTLRPTDFQFVTYRNPN